MWLRKLEQKLPNPYRTSFIVGSIIIITNSVLVIITVLVVFPYKLFGHLYHYHLSNKKPNMHKAGGYESQFDPNSKLIQVSHNPTCSCGRSNPPTDFFDIIYKALNDAL